MRLELTHEDIGEILVVIYKASYVDAAYETWTHSWRD